MITMLAALCHMATASPGMQPVEFFQEMVVGRRDDEPTRDNIAACYVAAQMEVAQRLLPGFRVEEIRCAGDKDGRDRPKDAI